MNLTIPLYTFLLFITFGLTSCNSYEYKFDSFEECLTQEDRNNMSLLLSDFEKIISNHYNKEISPELYKTYLKDFSEMKLAPRFFLKTESLDRLSEIKSTPTFLKIWAPLSAIKVIEGKMINNRPASDLKIGTDDLYTVDPTGEFINCLINVEKKKDLLEPIKGAYDSNTGQIARFLLSELDDKDYLNENYKILRL